MSEKELKYNASGKSATDLKSIIRTVPDFPEGGD